MKTPDIIDINSNNEFSFLNFISLFNIKNTLMTNAKAINLFIFNKKGFKG